MSKAAGRVAGGEADAMTVKSYRENRKLIPIEELATHQGKWVAFSRDGTEVIASAKTPETLARKVAAKGKQPQHVVLEYLERATTVLGGAELL